MQFNGKTVEVIDAPGFWDFMQHLAKAVAEPDRMSDYHMFTVTFDASPGGEDVWIWDLELKKWEKE
ncbi:hypothetical protein [Mycobacteroides abscessus]|uniref:Uncharacterized protein n=2 Tax=Mycobacteroides abscessus TaxID=36809 RepID=A0A829MBK5_9MYCO|nr:hypothetical protein [Mycobacteroides abscessus]ESV58907.1 hypothetical protein L830_4759 [Mycobacteroides abscessus MAB_082312_2258]ESV62291.1 hypothetical protein L833_4696 [Mycobacteroides abscessus MAB_091912_2446]QSM04454.1 hypothetical protein PROPHIGD02-2_53 [Mycobacterium phage prophiGD02-2]QST87323.1 hypothetical protein PROPHIGD90-1_53 [Mycobacterium phage prophiGD90-1]AWG55572.1 hypothetical protein DDT53_15980 [Mycobacteroides abscessus]